ncbi:MAG: efflux RND transporter permease subunit [Candidatus Aminicenantes bacterium]|nr:efflux RND transporter permease subunit [Candidatus Aminicenantes bacterium]
MKIPELAVNRKVTTAMLAMILVVMGTIAFTQLGLDFFPDIEFPTVSVITIYSGASSEDIENTITRPLEQIINTVERVKKVTSVSSEGVSVINVEFEWGTNLDFGAEDIRDQVSRYENFLPEESDNPLVLKFNLGQFPILFGGITADMPTVELKQLIEDEVSPRLERIEGVASVTVQSMDVREILVDIDKTALESFNLTFDQILLALRMENLNLPAGHIVQRYTDILVRTLGEFTTVDDIRNTIVGTSPSGQPVYLRDVAEVRDGLKEVRYSSRIQGGKGVIYFISKQSGSNTVIVADAAKKELERIKTMLPPGVKFYDFMDQAEMVQRVVRRTGNNAIIGGILAILFIFIFLRNWRPTLTIALAIPLSIITTFIALYFAGYTLNLLTLSGLALGVGMLVDNAIVVIESIFRHIEEGKGKNEAAKRGASEVGMAITASTLTTIAVFFPMVFAKGITARLTRGLALAIAFSLFASLFVALTIVPMVASLLFKEKRNQITEVKKKQRVRFEGAKRFYQRTLEGALHRRRWVLGGVLVLFLLSFAIIPFVGTEFMPSMDREMIILRIKMPVGTSLEETNRVALMAEKLMERRPEVKTVSLNVGSQAEEDPFDSSSGFANTGTHEAIVWVGLTKLEERDKKDSEILEEIWKQLPRLKGVKFEALDMGQMMSGGSSAPVEIKVFGKDIVQLGDYADQIVAMIKDVEGLRDVKHSLSEGKPEFHILINREKASRLGLMVSQIANTVQTASQGRVATRLRDKNEEIDIRVRLEKDFRDSLEDIKNIPIMTPMNKTIRLDQVATIIPGEGPISITRENQARKVTVSANIAGKDLGSVVREAKKRLSGFEKSLPSGYFVEYGGQFEDMQEAFLIMAGAFALATLLVYMIMASQFESFKHPFVIMFTIPLAIMGVAIALIITGKPVSLPILIGFIMLAGIAVNNGIVMVDYINQLKQRGIEKKEAIIQGSIVRLRPVLITALTTILGMLPMAIDTSSGSEMRAPMAITVIGGLFATTFLTLYVIPIIYSLFDQVSFRKEKTA